ncbi:MAG: HDOD domain-containing protein [Gammaproteobacteria bacterium]|nr:HDOD domain-containing protein [Gammaproteobacteria bacterium]
MLTQKPMSASTRKECPSEPDNGRKLFSVIYRAYQENRLKLPAVPQTAFEIKELIRLGASIRDVANVAQRDAGTAARLIKVANSPLYRGVAKVGSLTDAIGRIGLNATQNIAYVLSIQSLFSAKSIVIEELMSYAYARSCELAASCFILAQDVKGLEPDRALLAGLVSQVGLLPIYYYADQHADWVTNELSLNSSVKKLRGIVGTMVLKQWDFDEELVAIPENSEYWGRQSSSEVMDYCDLVILSNLINQLRHQHVGLDEIEPLPIVQRILKDPQGQALYEAVSSGALLPQIDEAALMLT